LRAQGGEQSHNIAVISASFGERIDWAMVLFVFWFAETAPS